MFKVASLIDLAPGHPSLLIPVFVNTNSNIPYVQSTNELFSIENFFPYFSAEEYDLLTFQESVFAERGQAALVGLRLHSGEIKCWRMPQLMQYWELNRDEILNHHLLYVQICRVISESLPNQYDAWRKLGERLFPGETKEQDDWVQSEMLLFQKANAIWKRIRSPVHSAHADIQVRLRDNSDLDVESLLKVLNNSKYYDAPNWPTLWFRLCEEIPYDDRLFHISTRWLYYKMASKEGIATALNVFCATIDQVVDDDDFAEFAVDILHEQIIFSEEFPLSVRHIRGIFKLVSEYLESESYFYIVVQAIENNYFDVKTQRFLIDELIRNFPYGNENVARVADNIQRGVLPRMEFFDSDNEIKTKIDELKRLLSRVKTK